MRITRDLLLRIARDTAAERVRISRRIICIFLTGSLAGEEPILGGTADIDLIFVEDGQPLAHREIVGLTDEVSLDIAHYTREDFSQPRKVRVDPWMGSVLYYKPPVLHDSNHWFDYTEASSSAQFMAAENVLARAHHFTDLARGIWSDLSFRPPKDPIRRVYAYLRCLEHAGNAFSVLSGLPLTERRFLIDLPRRAALAGQPSLSAELLQLLAAEVEVSDSEWEDWQTGWDSTLRSVAGLENCPVRLLPARRPYYTRAAAALWGDHPSASFWILARTWAQAAAHLPEDSPHRSEFQQVCEKSGLSALTDLEQIDERMIILDSYLDKVEEALDAWGQRNGYVPLHV